MNLFNGGMKHLKLYNMTTETKANDVITGFNGLTKREYFAAMAMQAIAKVGYNEEYVVGVSCRIADALIKELNASR